MIKKILKLIGVTLLALVLIAILLYGYMLYYAYSEEKKILQDPILTATAIEKKDPELCDKVSVRYTFGADQPRHDCYVGVILAIGEKSICEDQNVKLGIVSGNGGYDATVCYEILAEHTNDVSLCELVSQQGGQFNCYANLARNNKNPQICTDINIGGDDEEYAREFCYRSYYLNSSEEITKEFCNSHFKIYDHLVSCYGMANLNESNQ
jgi:hypothetical protein